MADELRKEVAALRKEVAELREMVAKLNVPKPAVAAPKAPPKPAEREDSIDEETMFVISAAVAAFLGKRATIRLVRPVNQAVDGWRLQGRVSIHGSHRMR